MTKDAIVEPDMNPADMRIQDEKIDEDNRNKNKELVVISNGKTPMGNHTIEKQ